MDFIYKEATSYYNQIKIAARYDHELFFLWPTVIYISVLLLIYRHLPGEYSRRLSPIFIIAIIAYLLNLFIAYSYSRLPFIVSYTAFIPIFIILWLAIEEAYNASFKVHVVNSVGIMIACYFLDKVVHEYTAAKAHICEFFFLAAIYLVIISACYTITTVVKRTHLPHRYLFYWRRARESQ